MFILPTGIKTSVKNVSIIILKWFALWPKAYVVEFVREYDRVDSVWLVVHEVLEQQSIRK